MSLFRIACTASGTTGHALATVVPRAGGRKQEASGNPASDES